MIVQPYPLAVFLVGMLVVAAMLLRRLPAQNVFAAFATATLALFLSNRFEALLIQHFPAFFHASRMSSLPLLPYWILVVLGSRIVARALVCLRPNTPRAGLIILMLATLLATLNYAVLGMLLSESETLSRRFHLSMIAYKGLENCIIQIAMTPWLISKRIASELGQPQFIPSAHPPAGVRQLSQQDSKHSDS